MKEHGILFKAPMVRALLRHKNPKTVTRRLLGPVVLWTGDMTADGLPPGLHVYGKAAVRQRCKHGEPGDRLWVRETWGYAKGLPLGQRDGKHVAQRWLRYRADGSTDVDKWKPSLLMWRWASRITLEIVSVHLERLQDITAVSAMAEGLSKLSKDGGKTWKWGIPDRDGLPGTDDDGWPWEQWHADPVQAYRILWEKINGPGSWDANPWVWVIQFKRL